MGYLPLLFYHRIFHVLRQPMSKQAGIVKRLKRKAAQLHQEIYALYLAYKDPRVPWFAK